MTAGVCPGEASEIDESLNAFMKANDVRKCPNCKTAWCVLAINLSCLCCFLNSISSKRIFIDLYSMKEDGCNRVQCSECKKNFCWTCLVLTGREDLPNTMYDQRNLCIETISV